MASYSGKKIASNKKTFEVIESNEDGVVFKRVLAKKGRNRREKYNAEMKLAKVTMKYFSVEELAELHRIEGAISGKVVINDKEDHFVFKASKKVREFFVE